MKSGTHQSPVDLLGLETPRSPKDGASICSPSDARVMTTLVEVARVVAGRAPQREKFARCLTLLEGRLKLANGTIMLRSPDGEELWLAALGGEANPSRPDVRYRIGEGVSGQVLMHGTPLVVPQAFQDPRFQDRIHQRRRNGHPDIGFVCVPLVTGSETVGTLSVDTPSCDASQLQNVQQLLEIVACMIAYEVNLRRMLAQGSGEYRNEQLRGAQEGRPRPPNIIGESGEMKEVYTRIHQVAAADTTVLIRGETGTGKELVASAIHAGSRRAAKPLIKVNCAALNEGLLESELFGHERGAFTGALNQRIGRIEAADGGTLFLDEIGDFTVATQIKLLRVLQEQEVQRVGSNQTRKIDVRFLVATNVDLELAVKEGRFRSDLYYRINVFPIVLAPLRRRKTDILLLVNEFAAQAARRLGKPIRRVSTPAINMLTAYHWPGNVRELQNCIEHACLVTNNDAIKGQDLPPTLQFPDLSNAAEPISLKARVEIVERDCIVDALKRYDGNISAAARDLGITARMVRYKIDRLGIVTEELTRKRQARRRNVREPENGD